MSDEAVRQWPAMAVVVLVATLGAGCGESTGDEAVDHAEVAGDASVDADVDDLASTARRSAAEPHRVTLFTTTRTEGITPGDVGHTTDAPVLRGEYIAGDFELDLDMMRWLTSPVHAGRFDTVDLASLDPAIHLAGDGDSLYVRAPLMADMAAAPTDVDLAPFDDLAALGGGWGRADLSVLPDVPVARIGRLASWPGAIDPQAVLGLVASADRVEPAGSGEVDGSPVTSLRAVVSLGDLIDAQGTTPVDFARDHAVGLSRTADAPGLDAFMANHVSTELPLLVKVDEQGHVRTVSYEVDVLEMLRATAPDGDVLEEYERFAVGVAIWFSDYGDAGIDIQPPTDAADAGEILQRLLDAG